MTKIIKPMADNGSIRNEVLKEIAELLAGPDGTAVKTDLGWIYSKPSPPPVDEGTVRSK